MPVHKNCVVCGKGFTVPPARALTAKACSNECAIQVRAESKRRQVTLSCQKCGKAFTEAASHVLRRRFCSRDCMHSSEGFAQEKSEARLGDKNPMWKGGVAKQSDGYLYERSAEHPFASGGNGEYVLQHRLVAEQHLRAEMPGSEFLIEIDGQKYLRQGIDVHHIDRDRANNAISNLVVCTPAAHNAFHHEKEPDSASYWQSKST